VTANAQRKRAIGHILLLAAGLLVLTAISAGSVHLVNKAREDARKVLRTLEVENQISLVQLQLRRAESAQRGYLATLRFKGGSSARSCRSTINGSRNSAPPSN